MTGFPDHIDGAHKPGATRVRETVMTSERPVAAPAVPLASRARLRLLVHIEAMLAAPGTYAEAVKWRVRGLRLRSRNRLAPLLGRSRHAYRLWIAAVEPDAITVTVTPDDTVSGASNILIVIDCRETQEGLQQTIASVRQSDPRTQVAVLTSDSQEGMDALAEQVAANRYRWICPIAPGDEFAPAALGHYAAAAASTGASVIYADDDLIDARGERHEPHLKPDWNAELYRHHDFLSGAAIVRVTPAQIAAASGTDDWIGRIVGEAIEANGAVPQHLPHILHHRRRRPRPHRPARSVQAAGERPLVTAIIPTRNHVALLRECIEGLRRADYANLECIVIDNDSDDPEARAYLERLADEGVRILPYPGPFNYAAMNNAAARMARGDLLCFLNNDIEMIDSDWLSIMVEQAGRGDVGAVGAKLLYPDRTIQHAGVVTGVGGGAAHAHRHLGQNETGYFERAHLPQFVSAVTAACLVTMRSRFLAVGGFDEANFPVAFNDVDLCLKLNAQGWQSFYEPRAVLIHHESKSRGSDHAKPNRARFAGELEALKRIWLTDHMVDPYHHKHLSPFSEQFVIGL